LQDAQRSNPLTPFCGWWWCCRCTRACSIPRPCAPASSGEVTLEAAASLGFDRRRTLLARELPLALRFALPALVNNLVDLVKMTAVASAIAVGDVTYDRS
jgi:polar amino acid transport system permease protein